MAERPSKAERKAATNRELARRESETPWLTWREVPLLILVLPFVVLLGFHVAGLAMLIRKYLGCPYFLTLTLLYALLLMPAWLLYDTNWWILGIGSALVLLASLIPVLIDGWNKAVNGSNVEHAVPAHLLLVLFYLLVPAINVASEARRRLQERQKEATETAPPAVLRSTLD
ncbi:MAG: hypothetical protein ACTHK7_01175 [Aureliella sp.]